MADALSELAGHPPNDPEAQAAINDFSDFTEFFPSDLTRSLTLIGKLDKAYQADADDVHNLTKLYSELPKLDAADRPDPRDIRRHVSTSLDHALRCREATFAEASRLCNVADSLYHRLSGIRAKLNAMPKPPSRDPTPVPPPVRSPTANRSRRTDRERTPRPKLHTDIDKGLGSGRQATTNKQKNRTRRIIVPGEIMPPFDPNSPGASIASDSEPERAPSPSRTVVTVRPKSVSRERSMSEKMPKLKLVTSQPKTQRVRPPGVMGTNVHSTVAGISVSNAMATLTPPPRDLQPGSQWAPWMELTQWEIYTIRRKMKKNANWQPSDVMVTRELAAKGRGADNYRKAKAAAVARGEEVLNEAAHESSGEKKQLIDDALAAMDLPDAQESSIEPDAEDEDEESELDEKEQWRLREQEQMKQNSELINMHHSKVEGLLGPQPMLTPTLNGHFTSAVTSPHVDTKVMKKRKRGQSNADENPGAIVLGLEPGPNAQIPNPSQEMIDPALRTIESGGQTASNIDPATNDIRLPLTNHPLPVDQAEMDNVTKQTSAIDPGLMQSENPSLTADQSTISLAQGTAEVEANKPPAKKLKLIPPTQASPEKASKAHSSKVPLAPPGPAEQLSSSSAKDIRDTAPKPSRAGRKATPAAQASTKPEAMPPPPTPTATTKAEGAVKPMKATAATPASAKFCEKPSLTITLPNVISGSAASTPSEPPTAHRSANRRRSTASSASSIPPSTTKASKESLPPTPATAASRRGNRRSSGASPDEVKKPASTRIRNPRTTSAAATPKTPATSREYTTAPTSAKQILKTNTKNKPKGPGGKRSKVPQTPTSASAAMAEAIAIATAANPDDDRYCLCGGVSLDHMVACEDGLCPIEWFHLECVGLDYKPTRREPWYCPLCRDRPGVDVKGNKVKA